jgi:hypothetical protein
MNKTMFTKPENILCIKPKYLTVHVKVQLYWTLQHDYIITAVYRYKILEREVVLAKAMSWMTMQECYKITIICRKNYSVINVEDKKIFFLK